MIGRSTVMTALHSPRWSKPSRRTTMSATKKSRDTGEADFSAPNPPLASLRLKRPRLENWLRNKDKHLFFLLIKSLFVKIFCYTLLTALEILRLQYSKELEDFVFKKCRRLFWCLAHAQCGVKNVARSLPTKLYAVNDWMEPKISHFSKERVKGWFFIVSMSWSNGSQCLWYYRNTHRLT